MLEKLSACPADERRAFRVMHGRQARWGFTLFEVSISMLIVAFGVVSVMMILPIGIKAQEMARFQIYVSAKAEEMIEQFSATPHSNPYADNEGLAMWDLPVAYKAQSWDFESRLSASRFGNMPLPMDIARRLDSANDQIREILDSGGHIYYSQPRATSGIEDSMPSGRAPNESQRVIIGIKGYAQQNWMSQFPLKNFPYFAAWPSPPMHFMKKYEAGRHLPTPDTTVPASKYWTFYDWPASAGALNGSNNWISDKYVLFPWETAPKAPKQTDPAVADPFNNYPDPDIQKIFDYPADGADTNSPRVVKVPGNAGALEDTNKHYGFMPYAYGRKWFASAGSFDPSSGAYPTSRITYYKNGMPKNDAATAYPTMLGLDKGGYPSRPSVLRYVAATVWYAKRKGVPLSNSDGTANPYAPSTFAVADRWKEVQAFRFLAHATTCLTGWYSYIKTGTDPEDLGNTGVTIPLVSWDGESSVPLTVTHKMIQYYHERAHFLINNFTASYPYDWAVPRSLNRPTMMDFPLMQCDLFTPPLPVGMPVDPAFGSYGSWDFIFGRSTADKPQQWRALSAQPIRNVGVSISDPKNKIDATMSAPGSPYLGTSHFGNIDHFNLTAPFEAAERCRQLIFWSVDWQSYEDFETAPSAPIDASKYPLRAPGSLGGFGPISWGSRIDVGIPYQKGDFWSYRNPERELNYFPIGGDAQPPNGFLSLATGTDMTSRTIQKFARNDLEGARVNLQVFSGLYGADRNYNHKLDRGPVPKSVRLRAVEISRFNFYDPRVQVTTR